MTAGPVGCLLAQRADFQPDLEGVRAMRAYREQQLEQQLISDDTFRVGGTTILPADLTELARPVREQQRAALVFLQRIDGPLRPVPARAGKPSLRELILAAGVIPERRRWRSEYGLRGFHGRGRAEVAMTPDQLG